MHRIARWFNFSLFVLLFVVPVFSVAAQDEVDPAPIIIESDSLYPEGITFNPLTESFIVTSLRYGTLHSVAMDGTLTVFNDDERLISTIGVHADVENNRLLACVSDPGASVRTSEETQAALAALTVFDLETGDLLEYIDLGALVPDVPHFCNDITVAEDGTIYVTDSFTPIIYAVDEDYTPSVLLQDDELASPGFSFNGITMLGEDQLLVAHMDFGMLYRVSLDDPTVIPVELDEEIIGADGINFYDDQLIVNNNTSNEILRIESDDDWESAEITGRMDAAGTFPTTNTRVDDTVYALIARLDVLFNPDATEQVTEFVIEPVLFDEEE